MQKININKTKLSNTPLYVVSRELEKENDKELTLRMIFVKRDLKKNCRVTHRIFLIAIKQLD